MARSYIVSPDGKGTSYTQNRPGLLNGAISKAMPGDEIVLKDGMYRQFVRFVRSGTRGNQITLRSETPQKAIIVLPFGVREGKFAGNNSVINTKPHSYITIKNLSINGRGTGESGIVADNGSNLIIEYNHIKNTGSGGIGMKGASDCVIRFNLIEDTGESLLGEGLYMGQATGSQPISNIEIYGNIVRRVRQNFIDMKRGNQNVHVHHNIFEDMTPSRDRPELDARKFSDGLVLMGESAQNGSRFEDNIIRDVRRDKPSQLLKISQNSKHLVQRNVFRNINNIRAISGHQDGGTDKTVITGNTFHNLRSYVINDEAGPIDGIDINGNKIDVPESESVQEEKRIILELLAFDGARIAPWIKELDVEEETPRCEFPCALCGRTEDEVAGFVVCYETCMFCSECIIDSYEKYLAWVRENKTSTTKVP